MADLRVTQDAVEVLKGQPPVAYLRSTQVAIEVLQGPKEALPAAVWPRFFVTLLGAMFSSLVFCRDLIKR